MFPLMLCGLVSELLAFRIISCSYTYFRRRCLFACDGSQRTKAPAAKIDLRKHVRRDAFRCGKWVVHWRCMAMGYGAYDGRGGFGYLVIITATSLLAVGLPCPRLRVVFRLGGRTRYPQF